MVVQFVMIQVKFGVFRWYRRHIMQKQPIPPVRGHKQKIVSYTGILLDSFSSFRKSWNETTHTPTMATLLRAWRYSWFLKHSGRSSSYFSVEMSTFSHVFLFKESHDKGLITLSSQPNGLRNGIYFDCLWFSSFELLILLFSSGTLRLASETGRQTQKFKVKMVWNQGRSIVLL